MNLSPRHVADVLGAPDDDSGRAPEVLPALLWEWVKTTTPPSGEAPVGAVLLRDRPPRTVGVAHVARPCPRRRQTVVAAAARTGIRRRFPSVRHGRRSAATQLCVGSGPTEQPWRPSALLTCGPAIRSYYRRIEACSTQTDGRRARVRPLPTCRSYGTASPWTPPRCTGCAESRLGGSEHRSGH